MACLLLNRLCGSLLTGRCKFLTEACVWTTANHVPAECTGEAEIRGINCHIRLARFRSNKTLLCSRVGDQLQLASNVVLLPQKLKHIIHGTQLTVRHTQNLSRCSDRTGCVIVSCLVTRPHRLLAFNPATPLLPLGSSLPQGHPSFAGWEDHGLSG